MESEKGESSQLRGETAEKRVVQVADGGWGWVVCATAFCANGILFGIINTFGIIYTALCDEYESLNDPLIAFKTSWVGNLHIGLTFFLSPIVAILSDTLGLRKTAMAGAVIATVGMVASSFVYHNLSALFFTYGVLLGIGSSLAYTPSLSILPHYFSRRLGLVNGIVVVGSPAFTSALSFLETMLIKRMGLAFTLRLLAVLYGVLLLCTLTWKTVLPTSNSSSSSNSKSSSQTSSFTSKLKRLVDVTIWKTKGYRVWVLALIVAYTGYFVPIVHLPKYISQAFPHLNPAIILTCLTVTSAISRLACGPLTDLPGVNPVRLQQFAFLLAGSVVTCLALAANTGVLFVVIFALGVADGCMILLVGPIAVYLLGPTAASQGIGFLLGLIALPMMCGPAVAGLLFDLMNTYKIAFLLAATPTLLGACLLFAVPTKQAEEALNDEEVGENTSLQPDTNL